MIDQQLDHSADARFDTQALSCLREAQDRYDELLARARVVVPDLELPRELRRPDRYDAGQLAVLRTLRAAEDDVNEARLRLDRSIDLSSDTCE